MYSFRFVDAKYQNSAFMNKLSFQVHKQQWLLSKTTIYTLCDLTSAWNTLIHDHHDCLYTMKVMCKSVNIHIFNLTNVAHTFEKEGTAVFGGQHSVQKYRS